MNIEGSKAEIETAKQIITLSTGAVAFTVTFLEKFRTAGPSGAVEVPNGLYAAWILFGISVGCALWYLMALNGNISAVARKENRWPMSEGEKLSAKGDVGNTRLPGRLMLFSFFLSIVSLIWLGFSLGGSANAAPASRSANAQTERGRQVPRPANARSALFAGGCFWSAERDIEAVSGVIAAVSGYAGGRGANPTYAEVTTGRTGHLEAIRVTFDPARISYARLVRRFLRTIDPTDPHGQFCDQGDNYRTAIFALDPAQARDARAAVAEANRALRGRVVTPVRAAARFWPAEAEHQDYARRNPAHYNRYRRGCGKDARLRAVWGAEAAAH